MSSHTLTYDGEEKRPILRLKNGPHAGTAFSVEFTVCDHPLCECNDVTLSCSALELGPCGLAQGRV